MMPRKPLEQAAEPRGVRPGPETPARERFLRRPDLLERRPVVGRSLAGVEPAAVALLEAEVHLEPAVVRRAGVRPAGLVVVDAEELAQMGRVLGASVRLRRPLPPLLGCPLDGGRSELGEPASAGRRQWSAHQALPVPGLLLKARDLAAVVGERPAPDRLLLLLLDAFCAQGRASGCGQREERDRGRE